MMKGLIYIFILCIINNCIYLNFAYKNDYNNHINKNVENFNDINTLDEKINEMKYYLSKHPDDIKENIEQNAEVYKQLGLIIHMKDVKFHVGGGILQNDALEAFNKALDLGRNNLPLVVYVNQHKGLLLKMMGKGIEAIVCHEIAFNLSSTNRDKAMAIHHKGNALVMIGKVREAIDIFKEALRLSPSQFCNYLQLVECYKELGEFTKLEWKNFFYEIEENVRSFDNGLYIDDSENSILDISNNIGSEVFWALFGAGMKADLNEAAWENLEKARDIEKQQRDLNSSSFHLMEQVETVKNIFTPSFFQGFETIGLKTKTPIFIVGMMRSGSTLVETMLDSHKDMWGMGEDSIFNANLATLRDDLVKIHAKNPQDNLKLLAKVISKHGNFVVNSMQKLAYNTTGGEKFKRIVDKMIFNYRNIGFIHMVYPNAVILHTLRDPMDTLFSCYSHKFDGLGLEWFLDNEKLALTYVMYLEYMAHFHKVLPGRIYDIRYDELVDDPEKIMKGVVKHIGLPWDDNIMNYNKFNRIVQTHSQSQVRLQVYNSSIGAWRKFKNELKPLIKITKKYMKRLKKEGLLPYLDMNWDLDPNYVYPYDKPKVIDNDIDNDINTIDIKDTNINNKNKNNFIDINGDIDNDINTIDINNKNKNNFIEKNIDITGVIGNDIDINGRDINVISYIDDIDTESSIRRRRKKKRKRLSNNNEDDIDNKNNKIIEPKKIRKRKIISAKTISFNDNDSDIENNIIEAPQEINLEDKKILKLKKKKQSKESLLERFKIQYYDSSIDVQYIDRYINSLQRKNNNPVINKLIAFGYFYVNQGQFSTAFSLFNNLIKYFSPLQNINEIDKGSLINVYMGLGSAQALSGKLQESIMTFNKLINLDEFNIEGLTRRSEVRAANNDLELAEKDLNLIMELSENIENHELVRSRGSIRFRLKKFYGAYQDFNKALNIVLIKICTSHSVEHTNDIKKILKLKLNFEEKKLLSNIYNHIGKCEKEFGNYSNSSINSQLTALKLDPDMKEAYLDLAIVKMETLQWNESFYYFNKTIEKDQNITNVYGFRGLLYHSIGKAKEAIKSFDQALLLDPTNKQCLLLAGISYHSLGNFESAINYYNRLLAISPFDSVRYRKELSYYYLSKLDVKFFNYNVDIDIDSKIKEGMIKDNDDTFSSTNWEKLYYKNVKDSIIKITLPEISFDDNLTSKSNIICEVTDKLSKYVQLKLVGFLPHDRHQKGFGLAVLEIVQSIQSHVLLLTQDKEGLLIYDKSSSNLKYHGFTPSIKRKKSHIFGWRDLFDIAVKWRQLVQPFDAVWWTDLLENKEIINRVGVSTEMMRGFHLTTRYSSYIPRALNITKLHLLSKGYYDSNEKLNKLSSKQIEELNKINTVEELYHLINESFFIYVKISSQVNNGKILNGTRLTIKKYDPEGYSFYLAFEVDNNRFNQFEIELESSFKQLIKILVAKRQATLNRDYSIDYGNPVRNALEIFYYWSNLSPLTRGTSSTGYMLLYSVITVLEEELIELPSLHQLDMEAILTSSPGEFITKVAPWLMNRKKLVLNTSVMCDINNNPCIRVSDVFSTPRDILNVLSTPINN